LSNDCSFVSGTAARLPGGAHQLAKARQQLDWGKKHMAAAVGVAWPSAAIRADSGGCTVKGMPGSAVGSEPCRAHDRLWRAGCGASGSGIVCAHCPGRAPGPSASGRVDALLALMYDNLLHPDAHRATGAHVRPRRAVPAQARLRWARQFIADTASRASRRRYTHAARIAHGCGQLPGTRMRQGLALPS